MVLPHSQQNAQPSGSEKNREVTSESILAVLSKIIDPDRGGDIVSLGMVSGLVVKQGHVQCVIEIDPSRATQGGGSRLEPVRRAAEKAIIDMPGVLSATVVMSAHNNAPSKNAAPAHNHGHDHGHSHAHTHPHNPAAPARPNTLKPDNVAAIIAVGSGKGGVGKSTCAVNIALGLSALGKKVGLLDADVYGPSVPRLMGLNGKPQVNNGKLQPLHNYGIATMSMGYLVPDDTAMIWRGPMVAGAIEQMLRDVNWGELDILVIDMPPGTGDAQLTLAQRVALAGAVIVSTPQDLAWQDARKGLEMFRKVAVPILGVIENMSSFHCPHCGESTAIFSHGGAQKAATALGIPVLGEVPLAMAIRESSDAGLPIMIAEPQGAYAQAFVKMAEKIIAQIASPATQAKAAPKIIME